MRRLRSPVGVAHVSPRPSPPANPATSHLTAGTAGCETSGSPACFMDKGTAGPGPPTLPAMPAPPCLPRPPPPAGPAGPSAHLDGVAGMSAFRPTARRVAALGLLAVAALTAPARAAVPAPGRSPVEAVDFERHVMGLFSKAGCNNGSCHGSFQGKGGFRLSLFGYDPARDHAALTREVLGRRIDPTTPDNSLLLLKATGRTPHEGGVRFPKDSWQYAIFRAWIAAGA